ncbi:hypothetical protein F4694_001069 [Bacillus niacini]|uniref:Uncharacterized protein n=1 Tax=Neobacillus niacini TaxID=86668 RepID=A0A852T915_9BACI|nr:hypothetical protein [Neobacillus niacini]
MAILLPFIFQRAPGVSSLDLLNSIDVKNNLVV